MEEEVVGVIVEVVVEVVVVVGGRAVAVARATRVVSAGVWGSDCS